MRKENQSGESIGVHSKARSFEGGPRLAVVAKLRCAFAKPFVSDLMLS